MYLIVPDVAVETLFLMKEKYFIFDELFTI